MCVYCCCSFTSFTLNTHHVHAFECERNLTYVKIVKFCGKLNKFSFPILHPLKALLSSHSFLTQTYSYISLSCMSSSIHKNQGRYLFYYYFFITFSYNAYTDTCLHIIFQWFFWIGAAILIVDARLFKHKKSVRHNNIK